jgi:hypothetical protein
METAVKQGNKEREGIKLSDLKRDFPEDAVKAIVHAQISKDLRENLNSFGGWKRTFNLFSEIGFEGDEKSLIFPITDRLIEAAPAVDFLRTALRIIENSPDIPEDVKGNYIGKAILRMRDIAKNKDELEIGMGEARESKYLKEKTVSYLVEFFRIAIKGLAWSDHNLSAKGDFWPYASEQEKKEIVERINENYEVEN